MCVVLDALDRIGRPDLAFALIRERWGKRMVDLGVTSTYEEWSCNGSWRNGDFLGFQRTQSHAWSACPASFLVENLLQLKILEPGCRTISLAPRLTEFEYEVAYPTPRGVIRASCKDGKVAVDVPASIRTRVNGPDDDTA